MSAVPYARCLTCNAKLTVTAFPALYRNEKPVSAAKEASFEDAACFYHPDKKAEQVCESCGRFLCGLCELSLGEEILCAPCLEKLRTKPGQHRLKARQLRYDKLAFSLAIYPLLYFPLTFITAPAAFFIVFRYWNKEMEFAPGRKGRMAAAFIFALLEIIGWIIGIVVLIGVALNG